MVLAAFAIAAIVAAITGRTTLTTGAGLVINSILSTDNPAGTLVINANPSAPADSPTRRPVDSENRGDDGDWPSYNKTPESRRFSVLDQINRANVSTLKVLCTYDTHVHENFETGPLVVQGALIFTSALDIYSIDPDNCHENWRTHEKPAPSTALLVNRGAAYLDGRLFRGTLDGHVVAYDLKTGRPLWTSTIADPGTGEQVDAAPIAWKGLVFIGSALGDNKGVKGRMYALDAATGSIVWETYTVPKGPGDPQRGPQGQLPPTEETWANRNDAGIPVSGGGTWTSYSLDPASGRLIVPVGNPSPDFAAGVRTGTNLYTNSVLVLDARMGD